MPVAVKKLHMAQNLEELKIKILSEKQKIKQLKNSQLVIRAQKLYSRAIDCINEEEIDEEVVYCYLYRAMELWHVIFKTEELKTDKKYYVLLTGKEAKHCIDLLEEYTKKLKMRYNDLQNGTLKENDITRFKIVHTVVVPKKDIEDKTVNGSTNRPVTITDQGFGLKMKKGNTDPKNESNLYEKRFINCAELKDHIMSTGGVLILDIRSKEDYESSKITNLDCVNIPETLITAGLSANKLGELITNDKEKPFWKQRDTYQQLVLLDWCSEEKDVIPTSPLDKLQIILQKWDPETIYKNRPLILSGGFESWLDMYPFETTNPRIKCPQKPIAHSFTHLSEHIIDYPDLDEMSFSKPKSTQKPAEVHIPKPTVMPTVDRSTKPVTTEGRTDKRQLVLENNGGFADRAKLSDEELMEEDKDATDKSIDDRDTFLTNAATSKNWPLGTVAAPHTTQVPSSPMKLATTPPRLEETSYPTTTPLNRDKGDGDSGITFESIKYNATPRSGGLKRSASSPNINKLADEELHVSSNTSIPLFDRSTKPKPMSGHENYSFRDTGTDSVYFTNTKEGRGLTGLKNLGNLCYMNSIMQCISNTVELTKELTRFSTKEISSRRQIASEVSTLLRTIWQGDKRLFSCRDLKGKVGALRQSFSTSEQQDSHEFLTLLIDWLHEDLNEPSTIRTLNGADESTGERAWGEYKSKNNSVVLDLIYGQLKSTVTCNHCQKQSILFEPFSNLSIPLPAPQDTPHDKDRVFSLQECLKLYLKGETISGWVCPSCKTPREATKKLDITRLPPVLIIHLKRFMNDMVGVGWCRKRMNMVEFPISGFDMKPYTHPASELRFHNYNLYAVSNHYGSMDSGHYTAYCKNHLLNKWYKFDDHDVNELSSSDVRSSAAYILFYESSQIEQSNRLLE